MSGNLPMRRYTYRECDGNVFLLLIDIHGWNDDGRGGNWRKTGRNALKVATDFIYFLKIRLTSLDIGDVVGEWCRIKTRTENLTRSFESHMRQHKLSSLGLAQPAPAYRRYSFSCKRHWESFNSTAQLVACISVKVALVPSRSSVIFMNYFIRKFLL